jgi:hypothetical protein
MPGNLHIEHFPLIEHTSDTVIPSILSSVNVERNFFSVEVLLNEEGKEQSINIQSGKYGVKETIGTFLCSQELQ